jgi:hypothetical protein
MTHIGGLLPRDQHLFKVSKRCPECGHEWVGSTFKRPKTTDEIRTAWCDRCIRKAEAERREQEKRQRQEQQHGQAPTLHRPKRTGVERDYDIPF